jgi:hypothetical protein
LRNWCAYINYIANHTPADLPPKNYAIHWQQKNDAPSSHHVTKEKDNGDKAIGGGNYS